MRKKYITKYFETAEEVTGYANKLPDNSHLVSFTYDSKIDRYVAIYVTYKGLNYDYMFNYKYQDIPKFTTTSLC